MSGSEMSASADSTPQAQRGGRTHGQVLARLASSLPFLTSRMSVKKVIKVVQGVHDDWAPGFEPRSDNDHETSNSKRGGLQIETVSPATRTLSWKGAWRSVTPARATSTIPRGHRPGAALDNRLVA